MKYVVDRAMSSGNVDDVRAVHAVIWIEVSLCAIKPLTCENWLKHTDYRSSLLITLWNIAIVGVMMLSREVTTQSIDFPGNSWVEIELAHNL